MLSGTLRKGPVGSGKEWHGPPWHDSNVSIPPERRTKTARIPVLIHCCHNQTGTLPEIPVCSTTRVKSAIVFSLMIDGSGSRGRRIFGRLRPVSVDVRAV